MAKQVHHSERLWLFFVAALKGIGGDAVPWPRGRYGQRNKLLHVIESCCPMDLRNSHPEAVRFFMSALLAQFDGPVSVPQATTLGMLAGRTRSRFAVESAANVARDSVRFANGTPDAQLPAAGVTRG